MLRQIQKDVETLKMTISGLRSGSTTVQQNGEWLYGAKLEAVLATTRAGLQADVNHLELILETGIIPDKYTSTITKQTYYPSNEELKQRENQSLPQGKHSFFGIKEKRKPDGLKNSQIKLIRDDGTPVTNFFMEHKEDGKYPKGGFAAKVKKGSLSEGNGAPKYAIKIYHQNMFNGNTIHELRLAMRSAYCYKQLGREGYAFRRNGKQYMVTEWIDGVDLDDAEQEQIQSMPIARRIIMAISLLRELNVLHKQGLIHHDIKPNNVRVNYGKLCFVDLDSVGPKNAKPTFGNSPMFTASFLPSAQMAFDATYSNDAYLKFNEKTDMYALGITLIHLFEEIYVPQQKKVTINVNGGPIKTFDFAPFSILHGPKYSENPELQKLLKNMVCQENDNLTSCEEYIDELQKILKTYPDYEQYLAEDRLTDLGKDVTAKDGEKAFKEIEIELLGFNQRNESVHKLSL